MRAYAIAGEVNLSMRLREHPGVKVDSGLRQSLLSVLDNAIAAGAMQRSVWYLNDSAQQALDNVLAGALAARGEAVLAQFASGGPGAEGEGTGGVSKRAKAIREAVRNAMRDLESKGGEDAAETTPPAEGESLAPDGDVLPGAGENGG